MSTMQNITSTVATYDAVRSAIRRQSSLPIIYATRGDVVKERTIRPIAIEVGKRGSDLIVAEDSLRKGVITLRIDRVVALSGTVEARY